MDEVKKALEEIKTEIAGLKVRIQRIEDCLLEFPKPEEYLNQSKSVDELFEEAVEVVKKYDRASASLLQRVLGIGYARAARLLDEMEEAEILGPGEGAQPREVLKR